MTAPRNGEPSRDSETKSSAGGQNVENPVYLHLHYRSSLVLLLRGIYLSSKLPAVAQISEERPRADHQ